MSQRSQALSLYRRLLKAGATTFAGDARVAQGWHQTVRGRFVQSKQETDAEKLQAAFKEGEEVITILQRNIVQGQKKEDSDRYQLRFRPETELGSNETVKQNRGKQLEMLRNSKGKLGCGGSASGVGSSSRGAASSSSSAARSFSTMSILSSSVPSRAFSTSVLRSSSKETPIVRPVPTFSQTTFLSDGSSIQITTTSPRSLSKLTRDPTNHPLWNPSMERKLGAGDGDESDRLSRFRKRFGGSMAGSASSSAAKGGAKAKGGAASKASAGKKGGEAASKKASAGGAAEEARRRGFEMDDLDWMSQGGREAKAGAPIPVKKAAAGKGKRK